MNKRKKEGFYELKGRVSRNCNGASYYGTEQRQTLPGIFRGYPHALPSSLPVLRSPICGCTSANRPVVVPVPAPSHASLLLDGMSRTIYNSVLPYTRPVGASDEDAARAMYLRCLRASCYSRRDREARVAAGDSIETLQNLAAK